MYKDSIRKFIKLFNNVIGIGLFLICGYAIYNKVLTNQNITTYGAQIQVQIQSIHFIQWIVLLGLMGLNYLMEAIKWKLVVKQKKTISNIAAIKSIFVGQTFAFFTPNRVGEYLGRTLLLEEGSKLMGMAQMAWASYAQLLVTILVGSVAVQWGIPFLPWLRWVAPLIAVIFIFLYFHNKEFKGWLSFLNILQIKSDIKLKLLLVSLIRYIVFIIQYTWVAHILVIDIPLDILIISISILFLCLSVVPSISITELVVRGQLLVLLLSPWYQNGLMIICLTSIIWFVNLLLPAIIGAFLLLGFRIKQ